MNLWAFPLQINKIFDRLDSNTVDLTATQQWTEQDYTQLLIKYTYLKLMQPCENKSYIYEGYDFVQFLLSV